MIAAVQIAVVLFPRFTVLDAIGPYEVLSRLPGAEVVFVAADKGEHRSDNGFLGLTADATFAEVTAPEVVVVPGGPGTRPLIGDATMCGWLRAVHERTAYTTSVCTGSLLLASAGLLDGVDATTHWAALELLGELGAHPVSERVVERGKIITAAGVSSGIDMALRLAAILTDDVTAQAIQLLIEYDPQPPFDAGSVAKAGPEITERVRALVPGRRG
jgi:transcriptional regulator GlxA family with amidase domain